LALVRPAAAAGYNYLQPAVGVIGQADFTHSNPNRNSTPTAASVNGSNIDVWTDGSRLAVCDSDNNRVLLYNSLPTSDGAPADVILGQADGVSILGNRGGTPTAATLSYPTSVYCDGTKLYIADDRNHRALIFNTWPTLTGANADVVVGQTNFTSNLSPTAVSGDVLFWPRAIASDGTTLYISDFYPRVLVFNPVPTANGAMATGVLGQYSVNSAFSYGTSANTFNEIWNLSIQGNRLYATALFENRILAFAHPVTVNAASALFVLGQDDFASNGQCKNACCPQFGSFDQPKGVASDGTRLFVADSNGVQVYQPIPTTGTAAPQCELGFVSSTSQANTWPTDRTQSQVSGVSAWPGGLFVCDTNRVLRFSPSTVMPTITPTEVPFVLPGLTPFIKNNAVVSIPYFSYGDDSPSRWSLVGSQVLVGGYFETNVPDPRRAKAEAYDATTGALQWRRIFVGTGVRPYSYPDSFDADSGGAYLIWRSHSDCSSTDGETLQKMDLSTGADVTSFGAAGQLVMAGSYPNLRVHAQGTDLYLYGRDGTSGNSLTVEKRSATTGALDPAFGSSGSIYETTTSAHDLMVDGSQFYLLLEWFPAVGNRAWRLERRATSDGALDPAFGSGGIVDRDPSPSYDEPKVLAQDSNYVYMAGSVATSPERWRLERFYKVDGSLDGSFGTAGSVEATVGQMGLNFGLLVGPTAIVVSNYENTTTTSGTTLWILDPSNGSFTTASTSTGIQPFPLYNFLFQPQAYGSQVMMLGAAFFSYSEIGTVGYKFDVSTLVSAPTVTPLSSPSATPISAGTLPPVREGKVYNYPNPLRPGGGRYTVFRFAPCNDAKLELYDLAAHKVGELNASQINANLGVAYWDGTLYNGSIAAPGLYFVVLRSENGVLTNKLTVIR
jgi:hypothetical protein